MSDNLREYEQQEIINALRQDKRDLRDEIINQKQFYTIWCALWATAGFIFGAISVLIWP
jgi:hypothetical protein